MATPNSRTKSPKDRLTQFIKAKGASVIVAKKASINTMSRVPSVFDKLLAIKYEVAKRMVL